MITEQTQNLTDVLDKATTPLYKLTIDKVEYPSSYQPEMKGY